MKLYGVVNNEVLDEKKTKKTKRGLPPIVGWEEQSSHIVCQKLAEENEVRLESHISFKQ